MALSMQQQHQPLAHEKRCSRFHFSVCNSHRRSSRSTIEKHQLSTTALLARQNTCSERLPVWTHGHDRRGLVITRSADRGDQHADTAATSSSSPSATTSVRTADTEPASGAAAAPPQPTSSPSATPDDDEPRATNRPTPSDPAESLPSSSSSSSSASSSFDADLELQVGATVQRLVGGGVMLGLASLLLGWAGLDAGSLYAWKDGSPVAVGLAAALPVLLVSSALVRGDVEPAGGGFGTQELLTVSRLAEEEEEALILGEPLDEAGYRPPITREAFNTGLWFYQMSLMKPWFPAFEWTTVGSLYGATCLGVYAQELLVRGWGGSQLAGWYGGLLAGVTDVHNPIYWAKVFKLVTPDTSRWLAALSLFVIQVAVSTGSASRAAHFVRASMNRLGRAVPAPGSAPVAVKQVNISVQIGEAGASTQVKEEAEVITALIPTAEERVMYMLNMTVSALLSGAANAAWAASGSLVGPFVAKVVVDGVIVVLQESKAARLSNTDAWLEVRRRLDQEEEENDEGKGKD